MIKYAFKFMPDGRNTINWEAIRNELQSELRTSDLIDKIFTVVIAKLRQPKTYSQLGYFHAEIVKKWKIGLLESGHQVPVGEAGNDYVKEQIKTLPEIRFYENKKNIVTGENFASLRSFATSSCEEMSHIIDVAIRIGSEYFGITFESPEEYKKRNKLKDEK